MYVYVYMYVCVHIYIYIYIHTSNIIIFLQVEPEVAAGPSRLGTREDGRPRRLRGAATAVVLREFTKGGLAKGGFSNLCISIAQL